MSADNYLKIHKKGKDWLVLEGCASNGHERIRVRADTRSEAINEANAINQSEMVEYGISYIQPEPDDINEHLKNVDRLEVIDETGRVYVKGSIYNTPVKVELSLQDNKRTLKVFVEPLNAK